MISKAKKNNYIKVAYKFKIINNYFNFLLTKVILKRLLFIIINIYILLISFKFISKILIKISKLIMELFFFL